MSSKELSVYVLKRFSELNFASIVKGLSDYHIGTKSILAYLEGKKKEDVSAGDISKDLSFSTPRVAKVLKGLEKNEYIVKYNDINDQRITLVKITDKGSNYINNEKEEILFKLENIINCVGEKDIEEFIRISRKIKLAMEEENND